SFKLPGKRCFTRARQPAHNDQPRAAIRSLHKGVYQFFGARGGGGVAPLRLPCISPCGPCRNWSSFFFWSSLRISRIFLSALKRSGLTLFRRSSRDSLSSCAIFWVASCSSCRMGLILTC